MSLRDHNNFTSKAYWVIVSHLNHLWQLYQKMWRVWIRWSFTCFFMRASKHLRLYLLFYSLLVVLLTDCKKIFNRCTPFLGNGFILMSALMWPHQLESFMEVHIPLYKCLYFLTVTSFHIASALLLYSSISYLFWWTRISVHVNMLYTTNDFSWLLQVL